MRHGSLLFLILLLLCGCSAFLPYRVSSLFERPKECREFLSRLDEKVEEAGVRDASSAPVSGFPYLRTNRFLASIGKNLKDDREKEQWVQWMHHSDLKSRRKEILNLPDKAVVSLGGEKEGKPDREGLITRTEYCSALLVNHDRTRLDFYETLHPQVQAPTIYSLLMRLVGVYPLFSIPVIFATNKVHNEFKSVYTMELDDLPVGGTLTVFAPSSGVRLNYEEMQTLIEHSTQNPLGVPLLGGGGEKKVVASFAPVIIQDVAAFYDNFGQVFWEKDSLAIDPEKPTVYYYISHALLKGEPILQINYVIWYAKRNGKNSPWIERGNLDGLTVRISLDHKGRPFMGDIMNNCGCYHFFVPDKDSVDQVLAKKCRIDPFVPQWLPQIPPGERLGIRIMSGWHQVERLYPVKSWSEAVLYDLMPYDTLEALPREDGQFESMFSAKGIGKGAKRKKEEILFFPMGVPAVGAMRQRGNHPIILTGRDYFDDPELFEKNFVFK